MFRASRLVPRKPIGSGSAPIIKRSFGTKVLAHEGQKLLLVARIGHRARSMVVDHGIWGTYATSERM